MKDDIQTFLTMVRIYRRYIRIKYFKSKEMEYDSKDEMIFDCLKKDIRFPKQELFESCFKDDLFIRNFGDEVPDEFLELVSESIDVPFSYVKCPIKMYYTRPTKESVIYEDYVDYSRGYKLIRTRAQKVIDPRSVMLYRFKYLIDGGEFKAYQLYYGKWKKDIDCFYNKYIIDKCKNSLEFLTFIENEVNPDFYGSVDTIEVELDKDLMKFDIEFEYVDKCMIDAGIEPPFDKTNKLLYERHSH